MQCKMAHDKCRNTAKYKFAGQNLYYSCSNPNNQYASKSIAHAVNESMELWYDEYKDVPNISEVRSFDSSGATKKIGHFTQLVFSLADRVGCSVVKYNDEKDWNCVLVACNYNVGNVVGDPLYNIGAPASQCKTGRNSKYPGLCSENENVTEHEYGEFYFDQNASSSPVVAQWLKNGKQLDLGGSILTMEDEEKARAQAGPAPITTKSISIPKDIAESLSKTFGNEGSSGTKIRIKPIIVNGVTTYTVNGKPVPADSPMHMELKQLVHG